ncbi:serine hydrolase domain-containing protein [Rugosimonospora africana]|uniref:Serine hydrolase n=1 Tax=Rugosimonospora africana TaxID=556532 RepID=A0A8J3VRM4_9ACTN|nr:serine hydrolase domain-containing protein [Rugosimonospora africana]GIH16302.1 serine hydrolase [Rugosimonospora africana]
MPSLAEQVEAIAAATGFAGVVAVDDPAPVPGTGGRSFAAAYGMAHRAHRIPNTVDTRFAIASGTKGLTALTMVSLIEDGALRLSTTARSVLGKDLPLIGDDVTVEQLLAHRSGIGDYVDEEADHAVTDYLVPVPVHELATTEQYLTVLDGYPAKFAPGQRFSYCNGGYVVLALIAERTGGVPFPDLVRERVCVPAGMPDTEFLRSDELPDRTAIGYLSATQPRTNLLHLPVRAGGDGGIYSTAADLSAFWRALFGGRIVPHRWVAELVRPRSRASDRMRYGLGFWLHGSSDAVILDGYDAGVSFRSVHRPGTGLTHTVISNSSEGVWPIARHLYELLSG